MQTLEDRLSPSLTRRGFLQAGAGGGIFVLSSAMFARTILAETRARVPVTAWVRIAPDNTVTLIASQSEMGPGHDNDARGDPGRRALSALGKHQNRDCAIRSRLSRSPLQLDVHRQ